MGRSWSIEYERPQAREMAIIGTALAGQGNNAKLPGTVLVIISDLETGNDFPPDPIAKD
ncbi:MAG: hypothetical protein JWQ98_1067 [Chlorobi bacterium]|nr:hypothetical protein [Chlorobiota bacterium]